MKLNTMANEEDKKAKSKLKEINTMIEEGGKYSTVENKIIDFFKDNCELYFENFIEDIEYLKNCRNKCAHLKVNELTLYSPSDYHARMLICSMYDNILSVKAPFIMDLFNFAKNEIEYYSEQIISITRKPLEESVKNNITNKYLRRMTYDSLKKSYKTFVRLLLVTKNTDCANYANGLFAFVFSMSEYIINNGHSKIFEEDSIIDIFSKLNVEVLKSDEIKSSVLAQLIISFPIILDLIRDDNNLFEYISEYVMEKPYGLKYYKLFYPHEKKTLYDIFKENDKFNKASYINEIYETIKNESNFNKSDFIITMVESIPGYNGYYDADDFMEFLLQNLDEFDKETIEKIIELSKKNNQITSRTKYSNEIKKIKDYLSNL